MSPDDKVRMLEEPLPGFVWGRKNNKSREIEEWVRIAEGLAADNGGILPRNGTLRRRGYGVLVRVIKHNRGKFSHIKKMRKRIPLNQRKIHTNKTPDEWVLIAERLANENGGFVPGPRWLIRNGHSGLIPMMKKYPEKFADVRVKKQCCRTPDEWVPIAERLANENGGTLPSQEWLRVNRYSGLTTTIHNDPEKFSHIIRRRTKTPDEWVLIAERLANENGGFVPGPRWLRVNGYSGLTMVIRNHPEKFAHIRMAIGKKDKRC